MHTFLKDLFKLLLLKALLELLQLELSVFSVNVVGSLLHKRRGGCGAAGGQRAIEGESDALKSLERQLGNEADRS